MSQSEDMDAINVFMVTTPVYTPQAAPLKDDWVKWYDGLGWYDKTLSGSTYDLARNKRNAFRLANARNAAEKEAADDQNKNGLSTEEMQGKEDRRNTSGSYAIQPSIISGVPKAALFVGAGVAGTILVAKLLK